MTRIDDAIANLTRGLDAGLDSITMTANGASHTISRNAGAKPRVPRPPVLDDDEDFARDPGLDELARWMHAACPELTPGAVTVLWKRKGGKERGALRLGKCEKPSGLLAFYAPTTFVVWLAVDHLQGKPEHVIEAVLYHELKHIGRDPETDEPTLVGHDFAGFRDELRRYGLYDTDLELAKDAFAQAALPGVR